MWRLFRCRGRRGAVVHHHFGDAAGRQAAHEAGTALVTVVDVQAEACRQKDTKRRYHPEKTRLSIGRLKRDHDQVHVRLVLGRHRLNDRALLALGPGGVSQRISQSPNFPLTWACASASLVKNAESQETAGETCQYRCFRLGTFPTY